MPESRCGAIEQSGRDGGEIRNMICRSFALNQHKYSDMKFGNPDALPLSSMPNRQEEG
jgi:hypothetical protein